MHVSCLHTASAHWQFPMIVRCICIWSGHHVEARGMTSPAVDILRVQKHHKVLRTHSKIFTQRSWCEQLFGPALCWHKVVVCRHVQVAAGREVCGVPESTAHGNRCIQDVAGRVHRKRQGRPVDLLAAQVCRGFPPPPPYLHQRQL